MIAPRNADPGGTAPAAGPAGSPIVRSRLKNPVTVFLYETVLGLLREAAVLCDRYALRLHPPSLPEVTCVKSVPGCPKYARLAIFTIYTDRLAANHLRAIDALVRAGYAVVLANNKPFAMADEIPDTVAFAIENHNFGRDLGAYLRTLRFLESRDALAAGARVLFLNDSVVFLPGVETVFRRFATAEDDWIGVGEIFHGGHHVTSWCFQLSLDVLRGEAFHGWAATFRPLQNRVYLIHAGEMGLSRALFRSGLKPLVLFDGAYWRSLANTTATTSPDLEDVLPNNARHLRQDALLYGTNQIHLFTFPGVMTGSFPFLKKDLLYRDVFSEDQLDRLCAAIEGRYGVDIGQECRRYLFARGNGRALRGWANLQWRLGTH
jgi:hypothetical protein